MEKQDWWIYQGDKKLKDIKNTIPPWRDKSISGNDHNADAFVPMDDALVDAVNAAIYLRRPLLVTGEPGIGKSSLAKSIAASLETELLQWHITSKSTLKDALYSYDALARLHDIQMKKLYFELKDQKENEEIKKYANISTGIENYLKLTQIGSAFRSEKPIVVLIDEIDKSDIDLPNDLLHIFEEQEFEIDELKRMKFEKGGKPKIEDELGKAARIPGGKVICQNFPIIVMTSNDEREFPPAFLRRCISVEMKLDDDRDKKIEQLTRIVKAHFEDEKIEDDIEKVIKDFVELKESGLRSNDQLLNTIYMLLNSKKSEDYDYETFKSKCEPILMRALD